MFMVSIIKRRGKFVLEFPLGENITWYSDCKFETYAEAKKCAEENGFQVFE